NARLYAVVNKNVSERPSKHSTKTKILHRPDSVFARRSATKILSRHKHACSGIAGLVQGKGGILRTVLAAAPVIEQKFAKASALDSFEELLGNDLVGINVGAIEWNDFTFMNAGRLHDPPKYRSLKLPIADVGKVSGNGG